jgi:phosphosulfolactate synthase (CoM biosynthesis protein A)
MLEDEGAFGFVRHNTLPPKPRQVGVTEVRGPYYSTMGKRYLQDILET